MKPIPTLRIARGQRGFLIIAAVFLLVVLAGLVAYLMTVSTTSQAASAADFNSARAYQAARAGVEWALYLIDRQPNGPAGSMETDCKPGPTTKTLALGSTLAAFTVTVTCSSASFTEGALTGATAVRIYSIVSNACNEPIGGPCPNAAPTTTTYVERQVSITLSN